MSDWFGDIREHLQGHTSTDAHALADLLWRARCEDPARYESQLLPYLQSFALPSFEVGARWQLARLDALLPLQSRVRLRIEDTAEGRAQLDALLDDPLLERVTSLDLRVGTHIETASASALCRSPFLEHLDTLYLSGSELDSAVLCALGLAAPPLLTHLSLDHTSYHHDLLPGLSALLGSAVADQLTHLEYAPYTLRGGAGEHALDVLTRHVPARLEHLRLRGYHDQLDVTAVRRLARSPLLGQLLSLDLSHCELEPQVLEELVGAPGSARLESLNLGDNDLGEEGVHVIANAPFLKGLRRLNLWRNQIRSAGFEQLCRAPMMGRLHTLNVRGNWIDGEGMRAVNEPSALRELWIGHNALGDEGARLLLGSSLCAGLVRLGLQSNGIEEDGFSGSLPAGQLEELRLDFNEPGERGMGELARSVGMRRVQRLGLMWCGLEDEGLGALSRASFVRRLIELDLSHNGLSTSAVVNFINTSGMERIEYLGLAGNQLESQVIETMVRQEWFSGLRELDVHHNSLSSEAIASLESLDASVRLPKIDYSGNAHEALMASVLAPRQSFLARTEP